MLSITITSNKDPAFSREVTLAERTTIGRSTACDISLPDPDKHISRFHALIELKEGNYYLTVISKTNPITINDQSRLHGELVKLQDGDRISIRQYNLSVKELSKSASATPWEDAFAPTSAKVESDPFGLADLIAKPAAKPDFGPDPFAMLTPEKHEGGLVGGIAPLNSNSALDSQNNQLLDPMFALTKRGGVNPSPNTLGNFDKLSPSSPFDDLLAPSAPFSQGNRNAGAYQPSAPLIDLGGHHPEGTKSLEHVHDINLPYTPPPVPEAPPRQSANPAATQWPTIDDPFADALGTYLGKIPASPANLQQTSYQTKTAAASLESDTTIPGRDNQNRRRKARRRPSPESDEIISQNYHQKNNASEMISLFDTFRNAAGLGNQPISPEEMIAYMESAGTIVRTAIQGIVSLLASRSMIKGELGAEDRTMVASRDNNPLKLMPDVEDVMKFLFEEKKLNSKAYLSPVQSIAGACEDLIYHELGTAAGMRAAVEGSIRRFNPQLIEAEFDKTGKKMVLNRKASLWETYIENYSKIERDMADDVGRIFERDFRRAYEEQIRKLKKK